ncbi:MAG: methyltransferase domain-containing protein [Albidovulum sp.]
MTPQPSLTDRAALTRNRARARRGEPALFLHELAAAEIKERLNEVNRRFTAPAIVTAFPEVWGNLVQDAQVIADDDTLPLAPGAYDLVIHAMALHWASDPVGQLIQSIRALKPDGLFLAVMPGGRSLQQLRASLAEAESRLVGGLSPRVLPMGEIRDLGGLLQRAGFALPVADSFCIDASYRDLFHLAADLRAMGEGNALSARSRRIAPRALFAAAARTMAENFPAENGRVATTYELIFLTGWSPDPSQQKPLKPGSAQARLADALKPKA